ncbi:SDR family oxidoreductase [Mucilaginibacter puniceus]
MTKITISIAGCGWYGLNLAKELLKYDYTVKGSTTTADKLPILESAGIEPYLVDFSNAQNIPADFFDCDILWIAIPPKTRSGNGEGYLTSIKNLINGAKQYGIKQVILISSTGVYADINGEVNEQSPTNPDTLGGKIMLQAEDLLKNETAFTTTVIRFAGLIGPNRHPGRFFGGKKDVSNGNAPVNLIHLSDCIGISCAIIDQEAFGYTYNACTPDHHTKKEFYTKAALRLGLQQPEFLDEKKDWKIISSLYVDQVLNYQYRVSSLLQWLDAAAE